jgi:hypothetical protein
VSKEFYSHKYDIFLSYRRDGGEAMATLLHERLTRRGYRVFLDIESLNSGTFNTKLLSVIEQCADVIVICSRGSFDRCVNDGDWLRAEIAHAFKHGKNIIPILMRGFEWPGYLPADIRGLPMQNGVKTDDNEYFDAAINRMCAVFLKSKAKISIAGRLKSLPIYIVPVVGLSFLIFSLLQNFRFLEEYGLQRTGLYLVALPFVIALFVVMTIAGFPLSAARKREYLKGGVIRIIGCILGVFLYLGVTILVCPLVENIPFVKETGLWRIGLFMTVSGLICIIIIKIAKRILASPGKRNLKNINFYLLYTVSVIPYIGVGFLIVELMQKSVILEEFGIWVIGLLAALSIAAIMFLVAVILACIPSIRNNNEKNEKTGKMVAYIFSPLFFLSIVTFIAALLSKISIIKETGLWQIGLLMIISGAVCFITGRTMMKLRAKDMEEEEMMELKEKDIEKDIWYR